jgi:hypothetical protein
VREGYFEIYKALRRTIKRSLRYANIWGFRDASTAFTNLRGSAVRGACLIHPQYFVNAVLARYFAVRV